MTSGGSKIKRFEFGKNWQLYSKDITDLQISTAVRSLQSVLNLRDLNGLTFLDVGSGSGLMSLAARCLGASVISFDIDSDSVECTEKLKRLYFSDDNNWCVKTASVLNRQFVESIGKVDIVYAWGVLHHTGELWEAMDNIWRAVTDNGLIVLAIYNDQGWISIYWTVVKRLYNSNTLVRWFLILLHMPYLLGARILFRALGGRLHLERGMSYWHDMLDWLGGYPFVVAKPEEIVNFFSNWGFIMEKSRLCGKRHGCNEFVFRKVSDTNGESLKSKQDNNL